MELFAHSSNLKVSAQSYADHVNGVLKRANKAANEAALFASCDGDLLRQVVDLAAEFHDLGKLDKQNQEVLSGKYLKDKLPIPHQDAGSAWLLQHNLTTLGALLVYSHHIGLPDLQEEMTRGENFFRDKNDINVRRVNTTLSNLFQLHEEVLGKKEREVISDNIKGNKALFYRIALSCLADGDHTDTAVNYGNQIDNDEIIPLYPAERLAALDIYVKRFELNDERSRLRSEVYTTCKNANPQKKIVSCNSPVGTAKTTAIMVHLLEQAKRHHLRRIIVVLPYINIITQSVETYQKALTLPGERGDQVVAELHHRADFQDPQSRQLTALWKAPIVITTAVNFFETLASNRPSRLRRLHNLPGSAIFMDESHAALPTELLPVAWKWIKTLANEWGCYWILASGSLTRFWEIEEFDKEKPYIPEIIPENLHTRSENYEKGRIIYRFNKIPFETEELVNWIASLPGPRLVILNTIQSAAVIAYEYAKRFRQTSVEHLSTALLASDRNATLTRVKERLKNGDTEWALIATSCVEAGINLSFKTGVREAASLNSLLQTSGRVNRHDHVKAEIVWTILLKEEGLLRLHPGMIKSSKTLIRLIEENHPISPDLCTLALKREIRLAGKFPELLLKEEENMQFPEVEKDFQVIESNTRTVVIDQEMIKKLENQELVTWSELQKTSVQIWFYRLKELNIPEINGRPGVYKWPYAYDTFIGYMAGILFLKELQQSSCVVL